ncbi:MAG: hypothetical protein LBF04_05185 [Prevotellaceae bacterium]|jgi:hypothetical protein|nr:hypothetical protein [Prevotellaceae bacterium]
MLNFGKTGTGFFFFLLVIANCEAVKPAGFGAALHDLLIRIPLGMHRSVEILPHSNTNLAISSYE